MIVLYNGTVYILGIMKVCAFLAKIVTLKLVSQCFHGALAVLVSCNQAEKCLQYNLKCFATKF